YARLLADGTVQVNRDSAATYLNEERDGVVDVPEGVDGKGAPRWETLSKTGRFEFHDHRMHWMGEGVPPAVGDESETQMIDEWAVPIAVAGEPGEIAGELWWTPPDGGGPPVAATVAVVAVVLGALAVAVVVARRRRRSGGDGGEPSAPAEPREAW
ncbi:MAG TPA: hypothetical protein VIL49_05260, partial [Capillimicrobium sp.]